MRCKRKPRLGSRQTRIYVLQTTQLKELFSLGFSGFFLAALLAIESSAGVAASGRIDSGRDWLAGIFETEKCSQKNNKIRHGGTQTHGFRALAS
jgi:hypothetical protein